MIFTIEQMSEFYDAYKGIRTLPTCSVIAEDMQGILNTLCDHQYNIAVRSLIALSELLDDCLVLIKHNDDLFDPMLNVWTVCDEFVRTIECSTKRLAT